LFQLQRQYHPHLAAVVGVDLAERPPVTARKAFDALRTGVLSAWRATLLVRETSHLTTEDRARVDEEICDPANRAELARMGTKRLIAKIKDLAGQLDVHACVKRNAKAVSERCVSVRPAPDLMVYLTALVPMQQGVQAYAQLKAHAETVKATGDERGVGQVMADTLSRPGFDGDIEDPEGSGAWLHHGSTPTSCVSGRRGWRSRRGRTRRLGSGR
jgi:hypothetical protein